MDSEHHRAKAKVEHHLCGPTWKNLEQRYVVANIPKVHWLKDSVADCKQEGIEVVDF